MPNAQLTHLESLQAFLTARIAPARALGVTVAATEPVTISAPLEGNLNDKGTGFAGSLFSVAALAGWALVTRWCAVEPIEAEVVLQSSRVRFLAPARGEFRAIAHELPEKQRQKLARMLARSGRGRAEVAIDVKCDEAVVMSFNGVYAVILSKPEERLQRQEG
ncbi:MAG TPA: YiiD C-terminal domain-containing protein [Steroidobacteraceae bacterium]|nr:YiiD C-terminal domain-containing protein [Steroidobacteraceae bacterium]